MPLQVLPATEADLTRSVVIESQAYGPSPVSAVLFPGPRPDNPTARVEMLVETFRTEPACRCAKVVDTDLPEDEQMIAFTMWYIWEAPPKEHSLSSDRGPGSNAEACDAFFGGMNRKRLELLDGKAYACKSPDSNHRRGEL